MAGEVSPPPFSSPGEVEAAFYAAFEHGDAEAMMKIWANDDEIVCVHPGGPRLVGRQAVHRSWQQILGAGPQMHIRVRVGRLHQDSGVAAHVVDEQVSVAGGTESHTVLATNVYRLTDQGWRMILHHASPAPLPPRDATLH